MSCSACAWCGTETPRAEMAQTEHGLTCGRCVRTAEAERMRQADAQPRKAAAPEEPKRLDELPAHLLLQTQIDLPVGHRSYPQLVALASGMLETALASVDLGALIQSQEDAYDRRQQTEDTTRELLWLVRWQTKELARCARELASTREQLDDAQQAQYRNVKGGDA